MDAKYLAEIKAREQAATSGPWKVGISALITDGNGQALFFGEGAKGNAAFIVNARTDIPALVAEVERLRGVESELAYEKRANETIPTVNRLVQDSAKKIRETKERIATLEKALRMACENIECWGSTSAESLYSDFIQRVQEQEGKDHA